MLRLVFSNLKHGSSPLIVQKNISAMVYEGRTNRLVISITPFFFGGIIPLNSQFLKYTILVSCLKNQQTTSVTQGQPYRHIQTKECALLRKRWPVGLCSVYITTLCTDVKGMWPVRFPTRHCRWEGLPRPSPRSRWWCRWYLCNYIKAYHQYPWFITVNGPTYV